MSSFSGFSEADILKLQNGESLTSPKKPVQQHAVTPKKHPPAMVMKTNKPHKQETRKKVVLENKLNSSATTTNDLPDEAKLINVNLMPVQASIEGETTCKEDSTQNSTNSSNILKTSNEKDDKEGVLLDDQSGKKYIDLDEFKLKQKYMEEQNRIRKEQVARALEDRTKRTQQEQQKLVAIQDEFKKLDATLSNDVKILRKQIESASYEYMEAQKKYRKIEKEFLDAKMHLHQKLEKKEMLTEHLCAIIEKNEERKADKLNELLQKLEVLDGVSANSGADNESDNSKIQDNEITSNQ